MNQPWIIAHRGARAEAPENTRSAFDTALHYPIDGIELDVQMTKDGVPVLYHDRTVARTVRMRRRVSDFFLNELKSRDWGGWYSETYRGEPLLTLEETLTLYCGKTRLWIEIKSREKDRRSGRSSALTTKVVDVIREHVPSDRIRDIYILSFDPEVLHLAHGEEPGWNYVLNSEESLPLSEASFSELQFLFGVCVPIRKLTGDLSDRIHDLGQKAITYSCNIPRQVNQALQSKADVVMTDNPGWLVSYLQSRVTDP